MKNVLIVALISLLTIPINLHAQDVKGDWVLDTLVVKGGLFEDFDKMLQGDGLELHLGKKSHLSISVLYEGKHRVKHKDSWYEGESFIILNDKKWGNTTYNILTVNRNKMVLERMLGNGIEIILKFIKKTRNMHHHYYFDLVYE